MKKIITLFASVILVASAFAQRNEGNQRGYDRGKDNDVVYNDGRYNRNNNHRDDRYSPNTRERDLQVARINREYDQRIQSVRNKWFTSHAKKERMIWALEDQRRHEIANVYAKFNRSDNRYDDRNRRKNW